MIIGFITGEPRYFETKSGGENISFSVAINDPKSTTEFVNCTMWSNAAKHFGRWVSRGNLVYIDGSVTSNKKDGQIYSNLIVDTFRLIRTADRIQEERMDDQKATTQNSADFRDLRDVSAETRRNAYSNKNNATSDLNANFDAFENDFGIDESDINF